MVKLTDISDAIEAVAPLNLQEEWDNSGWQVGPLKEEAKAALLCIDVTMDVLKEAISKGCDTIISHHPLLFSGVKSLNPQDEASGLIIEAIKKNISIYSSHTPMDSVPSGVSGKMCEKLSLKKCKILDANADGYGIGMIGFTDKEYDEVDFLKKIKDTFGCKSIRYTALRNKPIKKVAVCGGSGAYLIDEAIKQKADIFITADVKYHQFFIPSDKMIVADIGHFESEQFTKEIFYYIITKRFPKFAVLFSEWGKSPINTL